MVWAEAASGLLLPLVPVWKPPVGDDDLDALVNISNDRPWRAPRREPGDVRVGDVVALDIAEPFEMACHALAITDRFGGDPVACFSSRAEARAKIFLPSYSSENSAFP